MNNVIAVKNYLLNDSCLTDIDLWYADYIWIIISKYIGGLHQKYFTLVMKVLFVNKHFS